MVSDPTPPPNDPSWPDPIARPTGEPIREPGDVDGSERTEPPRYEGYQPRRPTRPVERPARTAAARRPASRRRRSSNSRLIAVAVGALVLGILVGWMARGGPPKAELVTTNQQLPQVTVTREVTP